MNIPKQFQKYYHEVSEDEVCSLCDCGSEDIVYADSISGYDVEHVAWACVNKEYKDIIPEEYAVIEFISENGNVFPCDVSAGRIFDISDELLECIE